MWNFIFSILFVGVLVGTLYAMKVMRGGFLISVPPFDAILIALAAFRITRLVVYDKITRWFRELFADVRTVTTPEGKMVEIHKHGTGIRHTISDLLDCPWCISFWSSLILVFCYFVFDWAWSVIFFLAIAGVGSLVQLWANVIGWKAENLKLEAKSKEQQAQHLIDVSSLGN